MKAGNLKNNLFSLEEIASHYSLVLMDTCAITHYGDEQLRNNLKYSLSKQDFFKQTKRSIHEERGFKKRLKKYIKKGMPIFITSNVRDECLNTREHPYKKILKDFDYGWGSEIYRQLSKRIRAIDKARRESEKLINVFQENNRIIDISCEEEVLYDSLYWRYKWLDEKKDLGITDFDFLISGVVLVQKNGSTALLSNDYGIADAWEFLLKREGFTKEQFPFFTREKLYRFQKLS